MKEVQRKKYQAVIEAGRVLFWKYGIKKVTVEDLCQEAGVSRMTFYTYFPNKIELAVYIFEEMIAAYYNYFHQLLSSEISFEDKLAGLIRLKLKAAENMSMEIIRDLYQSDIPQLNKVFQKQQQRSLEMSLLFIEQGKKAGAIRKELKNEFILFQLNGIIEMMKSDELLAIYNDSQMLTKDILNYFFYGIMNRESYTK